MSDEISIGEFKKMLKFAPLCVSDRVDVVRCKNCKYRIVNENAGKKGYMSIKAMCELDNGDIFALGRNADDPNWFCADGERRDT